MGDELAVGWEASTCSSALLFILPPAAPSWGEGLSQVALEEGEEERDAQLQQWGERTFLGSSVSLGGCHRKLHLRWGLPGLY